MKSTNITHRGNCLGWLLLFVLATLNLRAQQSQRAVRSEGPNRTSLADFVGALQTKAKALEGSAGMHMGFQSFTSAYKLAPDSVNYSDYVMARLLYEATRDAGFWNLHWTITDREPLSDNIWQQWKNAKQPSLTKPTA